MDDERARGVSPLALAIGAVGGGSAVCLATYFAFQGPFGTISDIGTATAGVLSACLAWRVRSLLSGPTRRLGLAAAAMGASLAVAGSSLVVSGTTGFLFAGLVSSLGYALIGGWLVLLNRSAATSQIWPRGIRALGVAAGAVMALGVFVAPGIALRLDDMATAPGWLWIGLFGWLGIFVVYPAWAIRLGLLNRGPGVARAVPSPALD